MNIVKFSGMAKKWRTVDTALLLFLIFLFYKGCCINVPSATAEYTMSPVRLTTKNIFNKYEKYKCESDSNAGSRSTTSHPTFSVTFDKFGTRVNCATNSLVYANVTEDALKGLIHDNASLDLSTTEQPSTIIAPNSSFCIIDHTVGGTVRIALCDATTSNNADDEQHVHHAPQNSSHHYHHHHQSSSNSNSSSSSSNANVIHSSLPLILKKCCPEAQRLEMVIQNGVLIYKCVQIPEDSKWEPAIFNSTKDDYSMHNDLDNFTNFIITDGFPNCSGGLTKSLNNSKDIWFMLLDNGSVEIGLKFWFKPVWLPVQDNEFCVDEVTDHDLSSQNETQIDSHDIYHKNQILLYCQIAHFDDYLFHRHFFGTQCVVAAGTVFILLIIYMSIWDKQNLAGWTQFNIFVALFFVVLMEGLRTLVDANGLKVESTTTCVIVAAIAQFFFFALNTTWSVMCFDLFYMFWKLETTSKTVARYKNRLIAYLLFSWGFPFVIVCGFFYFSHHTATEEMSEMKGVYAFAHRRCSSPIRRLGFQTQGIMFLLNLVFFLCTTLLIWKHRRGLNAARKRSRHERHTWRSVCLFMKLVFVMGVASLSIPVDYFFVSSAPLSSTAVCFRMIHFIPFVAVLFIFGFNEKNMILISQKYPRVGKYFGFVACTSGATASDTNNHSRSYANRTSDHPSSPT